MGHRICKAKFKKIKRRNLCSHYRLYASEIVQAFFIAAL